MASPLGGEGVGRGLPWEFTGLFGAGPGFEDGFVGSSRRGGYWLRPCFWFWLWFWLGLHRRWQRIGWTVDWRWGGGGRGRRGAEGAVFYPPGVAGVNGKAILMGSQGRGWLPNRSSAS